MQLLLLKLQGKGVWIKKSPIRAALLRPVFFHLMLESFISLIHCTWERARADYANVTLLMCFLFTGSSAAGQSWSTPRNCSSTVSLCVLLKNLLLPCSYSHASTVNQLIWSIIQSPVRVEKNMFQLARRKPDLTDELRWKAESRCMSCWRVIDYWEKEK